MSGWLPEGTGVTVKQFLIGAAIAVFLFGCLVGSCVHC